jgi:NDP-sugar pyrophosphorylase family protein
MKAMILAAGYGTRLQPLTDSIPKAMVPVNGMPIIELIIKRLKRAGFKDIIINLHYLGHVIRDHCEKNDHFGVNIQFSDEKDKILDTGGGIKRAAWFLDGDTPFLVHNVDVVSNIDLKAIYNFHLKNGGLATLAVKGKDSSRSLLFDQNWKIAGWRNSQTGIEKIIKGNRIADLISIGFCGIHVIDPDIFKIIEQEEVFSIITTYMRLAACHPIYGFPIENNLWIDIGSHEKLAYANSLDPEVYQ